MNRFTYIRLGNLNRKGINVVRDKIPQGSDDNCQKFCEVEVQIEFRVQHPKDKAVYSQTNYGHKKEFSKFHDNVRICTVKCPDPVKDVIGRCSSEKSDGICDKLLNFKNLFEEIGNSKIHNHA